MEAETKMEFLFRTRHNRIEEIFLPDSKNSVTTNVHVAQFYNEDSNTFHFMIKTEQDILDNVEEFKRLYNEQIEAHFERFSDLKNILQIVKDDPSQGDNYCGPMGWW